MSYFEANIKDFWFPLYFHGKCKSMQGIEISKFMELF